MFLDCNSHAGVVRVEWMMYSAKGSRADGNGKGKYPTTEEAHFKTC
jgi:hypothetical protein